MDLVLYAAPNFSNNAVRFMHAIAGVPDILLGVISQEPWEKLPWEVQSKVKVFWKVHNIFDQQELLHAITDVCAQYGPAHRLLVTVEQVQGVVAEVRDQLGIPGMPAWVIRNFRNKALMKDKLRAAGLPCARHLLATSAEEALQFARQAGLPLIVKPPDGAASLSTFKVHHADELNRVLHHMPPAPHHQVLLEEFIIGSEHSFDTFSINGKPVFHSLTHYYPTPLEVMRESWIQWQVLLPREVEDPVYDDIRLAAFRALEVLGMQTGLSHLEWFRRQDGTIAISEVAARPPGAQITTLMSRANDFDSLGAWAKLMIRGEFEAPRRKYAVGAAYLRGAGPGRVVAVHGLQAVEMKLGHLITDVKIPHKGQEKALTYEGEGYIILRHPETAVVREALKRVISLVRVEMG